jgi:hypothetical protein
MLWPQFTPPPRTSATYREVDGIDTLTGRPVGTEYQLNAQGQMEVSRSGVFVGDEVAMAAPTPVPLSPDAAQVPSPLRPTSPLEEFFGLPADGSAVHDQDLGEAFDYLELMTQSPLRLERSPVPGTYHTAYMEASMSGNGWRLDQIESEMTPAQRRRLGL